MEQTKIDIFIASKMEFFPEEAEIAIRSQLEKLNDEELTTLNSLYFKSPAILFFVSLFLGCFGIDRFLIGQSGLGVAKLLTCGGFMAWTVVDWFLIMDITKEENYRLFKQYAQ